MESGPFRGLRTFCKSPSGQPERDSPHFTTFTVSVLTVDFPFFGINTTDTLHRPVLTARTEAPAKRHLDAPDVMLMRIFPCEPRGMAMPTAFASRDALAL